MPKQNYFNPDKFIDEVIAAMSLGDTDAATTLALREEIEVLLNDRIVSTVIGAFDKREMELFEKILEDHPELDEIDAMMVIAPEVPGLKESLERALNSLYFELAYNARQVEEGMHLLTA